MGQENFSTPQIVTLKNCFNQLTRRKAKAVEEDRGGGTTTVAEEEAKIKDRSRVSTCLFGGVVFFDLKVVF